MFQRVRPLPSLALTLLFATTPLWAQKTLAKLPQVSIAAPSQMHVARDEFLRLHHWVDARGRWQAFKVAPRNVDAMTGDQLRYEAAQLTRTHRWDEASQRWVKKDRSPVAQRLAPTRF